MSRWIVVDDFEPTITYTGDWLGVRGLFNSRKADVSVQNAISKSGHKLTSNGTLAFPFSGTDIAVFGVSSALSNSTAGGKATIECFVDAKSIGGSNTFGAFPWTSYCNQTGLADGQHLLTATITADEENPFWLDFIRYAPGSSTNMAGQLLMIDSTDPAVEYSSTWSAQSAANVTTTSASPALKLNFTGTSLTWFSLSTDALSRATGKNVAEDQYPLTSLNIFLDGQQTGFAFPGLQGTDFSYNKILLEPAEGSFSPGEHIFSLNYNPTPQSPEPLTLDFFLIRLGAVDTISASALPAPGQNTPVIASATIPSTFASATLAFTSQGFTGLSSSQAPQTTDVTKPVNGGIRNDASGTMIVLAMLIVTLIRIVGW